VGSSEVGAHWFEEVADHLGSAYLRYSFTKGTVREVDNLVQLLDLQPGMRVLDVGCGPGRHAHELARRGMVVHGIDISQRFVDLANEAAVPGATFERMDSRALPFDAEFDVAISLCQGAFGLLGGDQDGDVLTGMARAVKHGTGLVCVSGFSAYFQVRYLEDTDTFDAATGVNHERTVVKDEAGVDREFDLWTTCFTPRELRFMAHQAGLLVRDVWSGVAGTYEPVPPTIETPELLLVAARP
jgi:SAM-dependent methyltransferase